MTGPRLGIDTATPYLALALWWPGSGQIAHAAWRLDRQLAGDLVPRVDRFLAEHEVSPADLGGIGVGVGPGSYTGARVGVAWATAVGRALDIPVVGSDTLAARAWACLEPGTRGAVAVEARRGEAWLETWAMAVDGRGVVVVSRRRATIGDLPADAVTSLRVAPDAALHARRVDAVDAPSPAVRYEAIA